MSSVPPPGDVPGQGDVPPPPPYGDPFQQAPPANGATAAGSSPYAISTPPPYPTDRRGNGVGLAAFIVGIVAFVFAVIPFVCFVGWLPAIAAIVLGIIGLVLTGRKRRLALAGLILGAVALIVSIVVSAVIIAGYIDQAAKDLPSTFPSDFASGAADGSSGGPSASPIPVVPAGSHTIVFTMTGRGTASVSALAYAGGRSGSAHREGALPFTRTEHFTSKAGDLGVFSLYASSQGGGSTPLACTITLDGRSLVTKTSATRAGNFVFCSARTR